MPTPWNPDATGSDIAADIARDLRPRRIEALILMRHALQVAATAARQGGYDFLLTDAYRTMQEAVYHELQRLRGVPHGS